MNEIIRNYLKKTLFWKGWAVAILTVFLIIMAMVYFYYVWDQSFSRISTEEIYYCLIGGGYLGAGIYINYTLYQGWAALKNCLRTEDMAQLEIVFKKQRHFWMGIVFMIFSLFIVFISTIVLLVFLYD